MLCLIDRPCRITGDTPTVDLSRMSCNQCFFRCFAMKSDEIYGFIREEAKKE